MNNTSKLFKTLSDKEFKKIKLNVNREYYYFSNNEKQIVYDKKIDNTNETNAFQLIDEENEWNPKEQNLFLNLTVEIENCSFLFGTSGVCYKDSILGIGLVWKANNSRIKKCKKIGEFDCKVNKELFVIQDVDLGDISSNTVFELFIYISKPGTNDYHSYFGNSKGLILYQNTLWSLIVEGDGSIFPIVDIPVEDGTLWKFECDFEDIADDLFDESHIRIILNPLHPMYPCLQPKNDKFDQLYLSEVMSSALSMIIWDIRYKLLLDGEDKINLKKDASKGSIHQALQYFHDKLKFEVNGSFDELTNSIKEFFNKGV